VAARIACVLQGSSGARTQPTGHARSSGAKLGRETPRPHSAVRVRVSAEQLYPLLAQPSTAMTSPVLIASWPRGQALDGGSVSTDPPPAPDQVTRPSDYFPAAVMKPWTRLLKALADDVAEFTDMPLVTIVPTCAIVMVPLLICAASCATCDSIMDI
jgi:hypothetical protein